MVNRFFLFGIFLLVSGSACAQSDTLAVKKNSHSPRSAALMSAVLPGLGQVYNKKYWKVPILYAGFGATLYSIKVNNDRYVRYRDAYRLRVDNDPATVDNYPQYSDENLITLKDFYRRNRDLSYIITAGIYLLNIVDASVDAHLFTFDVSDDLSLNVSPSVMMGWRGMPGSGLAIRASF